MLFSLSRIALHRLTDLGFPDRTVLRLMRLYDETCVALCEGQYLDIWMAEHDDALSVDLYFDMIGRKTAALIAASIEAGAVLATEDEEVIRRYRNFGWDLGIAFQLNDDLLGIWGRELSTGKEPTDVPRKKKTLPVIYAYEHAEPADRTRLAALYANGTLTPEHVAEVTQILERSGARDYTREQAILHRDRALASIDAAGTIGREPRERLEEIIRSVISA
jgi:geranylgeranyl diphosphate synthase, type I